jgi:hypothetical protein
MVGPHGSWCCLLACSRRAGPRAASAFIAISQGTCHYGQFTAAAQFVRSLAGRLAQSAAQRLPASPADGAENAVSARELGAGTQPDEESSCRTDRLAPPPQRATDPHAPGGSRDGHASAREVAFEQLEVHGIPDPDPDPDAERCSEGTSLHAGTGRPSASRRSTRARPAMRGAYLI